jgi:hypothetical protein
LHLKAANLARRSCTATTALPPTIQRIAGSYRKRSASLTSLVSAETTEYRLPQQTNQRVAAVLARAYIGEQLARHHAQPKSVVEFAVGNNPASEVTTEPRNCSVKRRSKSSRTASDTDSPVGFAIAASLDP